jgi:hypothetical protein
VQLYNSLHIWCCLKDMLSNDSAYRSFIFAGGTVTVCVRLLWVKVKQDMAVSWMIEEVVNNFLGVGGGWQPVDLNLYHVCVHQDLPPLPQVTGFCILSMVLWVLWEGLFKACSRAEWWWDNGRRATIFLESNGMLNSATWLRLCFLKALLSFTEC